jgi:hypothetical protein
MIKSIIIFTLALTFGMALTFEKVNAASDTAPQNFAKTIQNEAVKNGAFNNKKQRNSKTHQTTSNDEERTASVNKTSNHNTKKQKRNRKIRKNTPTAPPHGESGKNGLNN